MSIELPECDQIDRFWIKANIDADNPDGCWIWQAATQGTYGKYGWWFEGKFHQETAHRLSYRLHYGFWPDPQCNHKCDRKLCINPNHLYAGTQSENMHDMLDSGTNPALNSVKSGNHVNVRKVACPCGCLYDMIKADGSRACRSCVNRRQREYFARKKKHAK